MFDLIVSAAPGRVCKVFNDSFWLIGKGTIHMKAKDNDVYFGSQLGAQDSSKLAKEIMKMVGSFR